MNNLSVEDTRRYREIGPTYAPQASASANSATSAGGNLTSSYPSAPADQATPELPAPASGSSAQPRSVRLPAALPESAPLTPPAAALAPYSSAPGPSSRKSPAL